MKIINRLALAVVVLTTSACAFNPQQANLQPDLSVATSNVGAKKSVHITVLDERTEKTLGRRGSAYGAAAEITSKQDLTNVVKNAVSESLQSQGFVITDKNSANNTLIVEIRGLKYGTSQGFWTGGIHITGALKGRAMNKVDSMEKMYRYEKEERVLIIPTAEMNEKWINEALSETLNKLVNDDELISFLST